MKKLVMLCFAMLMAACPVACVSDPTDSDMVCEEVGTETVCTESSSTETLEELDTSTVE